MRNEGDSYLDRLKGDIDRILWGRSMVDVQDGEGASHTLILRSLTIKETNFLDHVFRRELAEALRRGMLSEVDLAQLYASSGLWTTDDDVMLRGIQRKVELLREQANQLQFMKLKLKRVQRDIEEAESELVAKRRHRDELMMLGAENRAEEVRRRHMVFLVSEREDESPLWPSLEAFLSEDDLVLVYNLAMAYYRHNVFDQGETRAMARSGLWRYRWNASKNGADLFGRPVPDWSDAQNALVYWSQYYDFVYESMDRPLDSVIEDDAACDAWYEEQTKKLSKKGDDRRNLLGTKKAKTSKFHQEQFVMVDRKDKESIDMVQAMNPESVRTKIRREKEKISKAKGRIGEWELRKQDYLSGRM